MYPRGHTPSPALFNILISSWDDGAECTLSKLACNTKLEGVVDVPEGCVSIQRDLSGLEKWDSRNLMEFNNEKCQILHPVRKKCRHQDMLEISQWERSLMEKDLWVLLNTKLSMSQQHALVAKVSGVLGCIRQSTASRSRGVIPLIQHW